MIRDVIMFNTPHQILRLAAIQKKNLELSEILDFTETYEATQKTSYKMIVKSNTKAEVNFTSKNSNSK